jgi:phage shock protein C
MTAGPAPSAPLVEGPAQPRRFHRSRSNRMLAGVCAGVADYMGGDPTMVRLVTAVVGLFTGIFPMLILYALAAVIVPEEDGPVTAWSSGPRRRSSGRGTLILGMLLVIGGAAALADQLWHIDWDVLGPVTLIAIGALLLVSVISRQEGASS